MQEEVNTPEGVPRLFDLIEVQDEKMKLAFFATIGNTLVAKDLDQVFSLLEIRGKSRNKPLISLNGNLLVDPTKVYL